MTTLDNRQARHVFLHKHALSERPSGAGRGADLQGLIERLGFVQVDSVCTVERAHHMILAARRQSYRPRHLAPLLERERALFEHWTHDAAVIPTALYPLWQMRFRRDAERLKGQWRKDLREGFAEKAEDLLVQIRENGPVSSAQVGEGEARGSGGWWDWHPSKTALEYLWRSGALSVCRREGFRKIYDLTERVIPEEIRSHRPDTDETTEALCLGALDRLGFGTAGEIAAFWDTLRPHEVKAWTDTALASGLIEPVEITGHDGGTRTAFARPGLREIADAAPEPTRRLRVLSPFDPALRDRKRAERLFGFHYRIEIFVPAPKRKYGYYVFPLLEGAQLVGRIDMSADRDAGVLRVKALWPEHGVKWGSGRQDRLEAELDRMARFAGVETVEWAPDWLRAPL